jgi:hypothetical protein
LFATGSDKDAIGEMRARRESRWEVSIAVFGREVSSCSTCSEFFLSQSCRWKDALYLAC